jgi:hypothetical protein
LRDVRAKHAGDTGRAMRLRLESDFKFKEKAMRTILAAIAVMFLASCATTSTGDTAKVGDATTVYHHKYHQFYTVKKQPEEEFVGAGEKASGSVKPKQWIRHGNPRNFPY